MTEPEDDRSKIPRQTNMFRDLQAHDWRKEGAPVRGDRAVDEETLIYRC